MAARLREETTTLIERGIVYFGAGGARGFDTLAALAVLDLKAQYPHIKLILVLPCPDQTKGWREEDVRVYEDIKARCDKCVYTSQAYTPDCMKKRNRHLVDGSSVCVCYLTEPSGGTAYTVQYARRKGVSILNITF